MRFFLAVTLLGFCTPLAAETVAYPVSVPGECVQLAEREHFPIMIESRYQAIRAEYKLYRLKKADPLVAQCQEAVARLKAQARAN